ncbi:Glycosyltransferase [Desulfovibrio sp. TomC]|nr:Glycosyltransferase [Desulfovibrio sp. TomC]
MAWHLRDDIRAELRRVGLTQETDFLIWWLTSAWREFPAVATAARPQDVALVNVALFPAMGGDDVPITRLMDFVWRFRSRDTAAYDHDTPAGRAAFVAWFYASAVPEMDLFYLLDARQQAWLFEPVTPSLPPLGLPLPRLARLTWASRPDVRPAFDPATPEGALSLLAWYVLHGAVEMRHTGPLAWTPPLPLAADMPELPGLTRQAFLAWFSDEEARSAYDPARAEQRPAIMAWARALPSPAIPPIQGLATAVVGCRPATPPRHRFGVNIIGYARGELGIGEDSRMCAESLAAAGVPFSVVNIKTGPGTRQADTWLDACISDELPYPVNIFCLTGLDTTRLWLERGAELFAGRVNIGYWPWELPGWPEAMADAYRLVDELWLSTVYTRDAFATTAPVPCRVMPMAVTVDRLTPIARSRFGLPEDRFLFLYVFDANSYLTRKNPLAAVAAFREAFPGGHEPVGLVLKTMNPRAEDPRWRTLAAAAAADRRITILADTLDRGEALGLFAACDAYVSPHRAEGFGRTLAEAMLLGKPVIATGHSGNADFLTPETGFPVAYRLVPVGPGEYPFGQGMLWAEPDRAELARTMRLVVAQPGLARQRTQAGRDLIASRHAPQAVGAAYQERLRQLAGLP